MREKKKRRWRVKPFERKLWMAYTTVGVKKTVGDIQEILGENGARGILLEYDDGNSIASISFELEIKGQRLPFRLPCQWKEVAKKLYGEDVISDPEQQLMEGGIEKAKKIAWRQTFYWTQAQLGYVSTGQVKLEQVFLSYMVGANGKTLCL